MKTILKTKRERGGGDMHYTIKTSTYYFKSYIKITPEAGTAYIKSIPSLNLIEKLASISVFHIILPPSKYYPFLKRFTKLHSGLYLIDKKTKLFKVRTVFGLVTVSMLGLYKKSVRAARIDTEIIRLYNDGYSGVDIARLVGLPIRTIYNYLERIRIIDYKKQRREKIRKAFISRVLAAKKHNISPNISALAHEFNISRVTAYKWLKGSA